MSLAFVDYYSESNYDSVHDIDYPLYSGEWGGVGQSFRGNGKILNSSKFYLRRTGLATGSVVATIYAETHATAFGINSRPTGVVLATSNIISALDIPTIASLVTFDFSGSNKITLTDGVCYIVAIEYSSGDASNRLEVYADATSPTHAGNIVYLFGGVWGGTALYDLFFYVYGDGPEETTDYIYKHFSSSGYVGILSPLNDFNVLKQINTSGTQIILELGVPFESSLSTITSESIVTETPDNIVDELGNDISSSSAVTLSGIPMLNDRIEVWEITDSDPTGTRVFNGLVSKWGANYSGDTTTITVLSYGVQLDNYLVQIVPNSEATSNTIDNYDADIELFGIAAGGGDSSVKHSVSQSFQVVTPLDISSISVNVTGVENLYQISQTSFCSIYLYEGTPTLIGSLLDSVMVSNISVLGMTEFIFTTPISLLATTDYFFDCIGGGYTNRGGSTLTLGYETTGTYPTGKMYEHLTTSTANSKGDVDTVDTYTETAHDLIFSIKTPTGGIGNQFNSYDPSNIVRSLLDNFISLGGNLTYTTDSIENTGTTVSYTFKFNTYLEGIKKCIELAPSNWFWSVDSGTGVVSFKPKPTLLSHTIIKGKHVNNLKIEQSLEGVVNSVYFSGGATAGVNLQVNDSNTTSIANYGQWLELTSDNRVTDTTSANIIVSGIINQKSEPRFSVSNLVILATAYDISTFEIGQLVGFANFNELVNSLQLQIMSIVYTPDSATLNLEVLPPTQSKRVEDIKRNLVQQQTENNPAT